MRITAIETVLNPTWSNFLWVRVETDTGLVGTGETFRHPTPVATYIHDVAAPFLMRQDPRPVARHAHDLATSGGLRFLGYPTRSVEIRANSALDLALWDLKAQAAGLALHELLGGPVRDRVAVYNTCAGAGYNWSAGTARARLEGEAGDDLALQHDDPAALARSLLADGITAMKIWPFDRAAEATGGHRIGGAELEAGLAKLAAIRDAVGDRMDILLEYHGLWHPAPARRILMAADAYAPFWHEDPVAMENLTALAELRRRSATPIAGSESHATATWLRDALAAGALDYCHFDLAWTGGISEARRVAGMAAAHGMQIAPHDCTGPVTWMANLHLCLAEVNALWLESVRAYYTGLYPELVTALPVVENGEARYPGGAGLGTALSAHLLDHPETVIRRSAA